MTANCSFRVSISSMTDDHNTRHLQMLTPTDFWTCCHSLAGYQIPAASQGGCSSQSGQGGGATGQLLAAPNQVPTAAPLAPSSLSLNTKFYFSSFVTPFRTIPPSFQKSLCNSPVTVQCGWWSSSYLTWRAWGTCPLDSFVGFIRTFCTLILLYEQGLFTPFGRCVVQGLPQRCELHGLKLHFYLWLVVLKFWLL